ncbi:hypothetical protein H2248_001571 [Termitomyces sp. 'cryptogamus']|nr:hypothetical protein H2248_001571 [Termitomyces sp. 'cryptogamus']
MPHKIHTGCKPDITHLRPFGCTAYAKVPKEDGASKLAPRSVKCALIGYFGVSNYKLLEHTMGCIFQACSIIFKKGLGHQTLPDSHESSVADIYEILNEPNVADGTPSMGEDGQDDTDAHNAGSMPPGMEIVALATPEPTTKL